jgi:predicted RNA-binding Zn-ribbon protein involved in translation (DUF1610 family)
MAKKQSKMKCPACGADMNYHATKVDYSAAMKNPKKMDADFGGMVEEFHSCPKCGNTASRKAE